eukprot:CAMPEP_0184481690 /NCGR_PEP_ID=MMETSP0113_2-20130426/3254_1 /TAXON_ID=91329 /ORGANISM="Norrisiella sphaerica, Strain BC52" /LENGTH=739 /DNA_ID=CAMNT_0026860971 /DNA_START=12 /DNA_END=2231 /DNA_ORIENTATION=+
MAGGEQKTSTSSSPRFGFRTIFRLFSGFFACIVAVIFYQYAQYALYETGNGVKVRASVGSTSVGSTALLETDKINFNSSGPFSVEAHIIHNRTYFDGAGIYKAMPVPSNFPISIGTTTLIWTVAFKTDQAGPLLSLRIRRSNANNLGPMHMCTYIAYGHVAVWIGNNAPLNSTRGEISDGLWHVVDVILQPRERKLTLYIDGEKDSFKTLKPSVSEKKLNVISLDGKQLPQETDQYILIAGYGSERFPSFEHVAREDVLLTIVSRTYFYGLIGHGLLRVIGPEEDLPSAPLISEMARRLLESLRISASGVPEVKAPATVSLASSSTIASECFSSRVSKINSSDLEANSFVILLVGNLRTFGANFRAISELFACALGGERLVGAVATSARVQHSDRAWYMDPRSLRRGRGKDANNAVKAGKVAENMDAESPVPPSFDVLMTLRDRDGSSVCYPFEAVVVAEEEFREFHPNELVQRPLDTDRDKALYFRKLTYNKILYLRRALARAEASHLDAYGKPLPPSAPVFVGRPDMRPQTPPFGIYAAAKALKEDPLRVFVQEHPVWGHSDMVFITSVLAARRLTRVNLTCAFQEGDVASKAFLETVMEPEIQLGYLFRLLCLDVFVENHPRGLLDWVKVTHEFDHILNGIQTFGPSPEMPAHTTQPRCISAQHLREKRDVFSSSQELPTWVLAKPFRSLADGKRLYQDTRWFEKLFRDLGPRFCNERGTAPRGGDASRQEPSCLV